MFVIATIPKHIPDARNLGVGTLIDFGVNRYGEVVLHKLEEIEETPDRFNAARGKADVKWRTDDLMVMLRGEG